MSHFNLSPSILITDAFAERAAHQNAQEPQEQSPSLLSRLRELFFGRPTGDR